MHDAPIILIPLICAPLCFGLVLLFRYHPRLKKYNDPPLEKKKKRNND